MNNCKTINQITYIKWIHSTNTQITESDSRGHKNHRRPVDLINNLKPYNKENW